MPGNHQAIIWEAPMPNTPELTISIVSYNTCTDLLRCLESIYGQPPSREFEVIVVDNGSVDDSVTQVRARFPQTRVMETGENLGYGRANNRALLGAPGRYYAILNSDLVLRSGSLDACCDCLEAHEDVGVVGGALLNPDELPQMDWAAGELTVRAVAFEQLFLAALFPKSRLFGDYFRGWWTRNDTRALPQVCGAYMVIKAELFNQLGGFDPAYFMYCEDTDLCKRITLDAKSCTYLHTAEAIHGHGKSSAGALRPRMVLEHNVSRCRFLARFYGPAATRRARGYMIAGSFLRLLLWSAMGSVLRRPWLRDKARGYAEVLRGTRAIRV
jgi:GT2 family glycosyltransferase